MVSSVFFCHSCTIVAFMAMCGGSLASSHRDPAHFPQTIAIPHHFTNVVEFIERQVFFSSTLEPGFLSRPPQRQCIPSHHRHQYIPSHPRAMKEGTINLRKGHMLHFNRPKLHSRFSNRHFAGGSHRIKSDR
jgi:hypothetical protein